MELKKIRLPSGAELSLNLAPFADALNLKQVLASEAIGIPISKDLDHFELIKLLACTGFSSKAIEAALQPCLKVCLYNGTRIDSKTFEPVDARQDYLPILIAVIKENVEPFMKGLLSEYGSLVSLALAKLRSTQESTPTTTTSSTSSGSVEPGTPVQ